MAEEITINDIGLNSKQFASLKYMNWAVNQTFTYANNSQFYALVNPTYYDYYNRIVRLNLEWFDGYVLGFHNQQNGIMSTRIATALVNGIIGNVFQKKLVFDRVDKTSDYKALDKLNEWMEKDNFLGKVKLASKYSGASGTSVIKLNQSYKDIYTQPLRQDQFFYETDFQGNITKITTFLKAYVNVFNTTDEEKEQNFFVVEKRYYSTDIDIPTRVENLNGEIKTYYKKPSEPVPVVEYKVLYYQGRMFENSMASKARQQTLSFHDLPKGFKDIIKKDFTALRFDTPCLLPFKDLGCYVLQINGQDPTIPNGMFGASFLTDIRSCLVEYELICAYALRDLYNSQGRIGIPKSLSMNDVNGQGIYDISMSNYETFSGDPDKQKPIITQFEIRANEWSVKKDDCLKKMATILGMSPKVIASYINPRGGFGKTATEVENDEASSQTFIEDKRTNLIVCLNKVISTILKFYGYYQHISARFIEGENRMSPLQVKTIIFKYQQGLIDLKETLRELNPNATESEVDDLVLRARERQKEIASTEQLDIDNFGKYLNEDTTN